MTDGVAVATVTVNPTVDVGLVVERLVAEHKMLATAARREPGGGGVNVARSLRRLGTRCLAVVVTGGATGAELGEMLDDEGVPTHTLAVPGATRESISLRDASVGAQYRVVVDGPTIEDPEGLIAGVVEACDGVPVVVLSGRLNPGLPPDTYARIVHGLPDASVVVDCAPPALEAACQASVALVKPSRRELEGVVGRPLEDVTAVVAAASEILETGGAAAMVVSLGAEGAVLVQVGRPALRFEAPPIERLVSTVGCGDAMVAGMVQVLGAGRPLDAAVRFGIACGTAAATTPGTELFDPAVARRLEATIRAPVVV